MDKREVMQKQFVDSADFREEEKVPI